jgi:site-specific recombinase XerD
MGRTTFKLITTSEELLEKINPANKDLAKQFLKEKNSRSSPLTIKNYESDLNMFFCWNLQENENKLFTDIRKLEFSTFFSYCIETLQWGSARAARMKAALSSFSNFIEKFYDDKYPTFRNIILRAVESMPKNPRREKTVLSEEQVNELFNYLDNELKDIQMSCWLALAIASGARFSELFRFSTDIIDFSHTAFDDLFLETLRPIKTKGRGKEGKMLIKYIIKDIFVERYKKWLEVRQGILTKNNKSHNFIFIKSNGDPAQESTVRTWVKRIEKHLGVPFYPHSLRHYYTTFLSKASLPTDLIQEICGWASDSMVKIYNDSSIKDKTFKELDNLKSNIDKQ